MPIVEGTVVNQRMTPTANGNRIISITDRHADMALTEDDDESCNNIGFPNILISTLVLVRKFLLLVEHHKESLMVRQNLLQSTLVDITSRRIGG